MASKPRIVVFSIIPRLGEMIKASLPSENVKIVHFKSQKTVRHGYGFVTDEVSQLEDAEILVAENASLPLIADKLPHLRWFQGTWAGLEVILQHFKNKEPPSYSVTRMSSQGFCQLMSEYVLGQILLHERDWLRCHYNQKEKLWDQSGTIVTYRSVSNLTVGVIGVGEIGSEVCRALKAMRARVLGYSRSPKDPAAVSGLTDAHYSGGRDALKTVLSESDYIVSCVPNTPHTNGLFDQDTLASAKEGSVLINIGRSNVIIQDDLLKCLDQGPLAGAVLDVFDPEPLDVNSPYWTHPKVKITPHCSGISRAPEVSAAFNENYRRFMAGEPLLHTVDVTKDY